MSSLYREQAHNVRRTFFFMGLFLIVVIAISWLISVIFASPAILYIAVILSVGLNVVAYWKSDTIVIRITRAKPVTRDTHFDYWNSVENLCISIGVPMPKLYVIDDPAPNAFATGRDPKHAAVAVTSGLLHVMEKQELEGVLAHEIAHIQNRDTLIMTVIVVLFGMVTILLDLALHASLFSSDEEGGNMLILLPIYIVAPIILMIIRFAVSRKREFLADATAGVYTRYPEGLASALRKIERASRPVQGARTATAHLFIADPFASHARGRTIPPTEKRLGFMRLFDTHPPIPERVQALVGNTGNNG
ncbi:MAG: M48 family metalloprotease [Candidatus Kaiserbacteria bacterium]|nr:M48 family metalloprotease [Candidatus Kaiserbacteria bacterium]